MKYALPLLLITVTLLTACAPDATPQPTLPPHTHTPTATAAATAIPPTATPTNTPRPTPTPNYPLPLQTPISALQPITTDNLTALRPVSRLIFDGLPQSTFDISSWRPRHPLWIFSSDLSRAALVQPDYVAILDVAGTGESMQTLRLTDDRPWSDGAFLKNNKFLTLGQGSLSLFDLSSGRELKKIDLYCCLDKRLYLLPDGERALVPTRTGMDLYEVETLERIQGYDAPGNSSMVADVSLDGKLLALAGERNKSVFIFDVERAVVNQTLKVERFVAVNVKFLGNDQVILTDELSDFNLLQFWDATTGKKLREIQLTDEMFGLPAKERFRVASVAVHPSGEFFVMAISSSKPLLVFWEADADQPFAVMDAAKYGVRSFYSATKTDFMEFVDESRLLILGELWGVLP
ncbi:MAG: WD40 repeat domain-containing protein [Chloroflexi bacterium]|nr:WD40 repeat domain-containing protein [Chloroflexota bacterium]